MTPLELADACEKATGPDRELDAAIALKLGIVRERDGSLFYGHRDHSVLVLERDYYDHEGNAPELLHYTASIDAAMTLVPEGLHWCCQTDRDGAVATVGRADSDARGIFYTDCKQATAKTLPLAICAAALRAGRQG